MTSVLISTLTLLIFSAASAATISGKIALKKKNGDKVADTSNVVVFLDGLKDPSLPKPTTPAAIVQKDKMYVPSVLPVMVGMDVDFPNEDTIMHNVFSKSKAKDFDLGLYKKGSKKTVRFDKAGLVKIYCNIHEKMVAFILVLDNPYYTVTDKDGNFKIDNLPNGKYQLAAWGRFSEIQRKDIEIKNNGSEIRVDLNLVKGDEVGMDLVEKEVDDKHLNKWGEPYKAKY